MTISTQALRMRLELKRLAQAHRVQAEPNPIPLTAPTTTAMVFEGYAATIDVDLDRTKLRPYVLGFPLSKTFRSVPLLFKHDPNVVAGKIEDLDYDDEGNIVIRATVTHETARRCGAFSIKAKVNDYEIKNRESLDFFALITSATLTEISITDTPSNPEAKVMFRYRTSPQVELDLMARRVACLTRMTTLLKQEIARP